ALKASYTKDDYGPLRKENIQYLDYYTASVDYRVEAEVEMLIGEKPFRMPTYDGTSNEYKRYALLHFIVNAQKHTLTVYQSVALFQNPQYKDYLFLPCLDQSNGVETYTRGRYIELDASQIRWGKIFIDFNKAYNP